MTVSLDFDRDGRDWPNREASRFVDAAGIRFHVQVMGQGAPLLLLHGTGSSTHSWRDVMPRLAERFTVIAPDLPGHGFTKFASARDLSRAGMAHGVAALLRVLDMAPTRAVGHSAGAVILLEIVGKKLAAIPDLVSFNGAFFPVSGLGGQFFSPLAKLITGFGFVPRLVTSMVDKRSVERLLRDTGSEINARGIALYQRLFSSEAHVAGTLKMMAEWTLTDTQSQLRHLQARLHLVKALGDKTVPPDTADRVAMLVPYPHLITIPRLGHLAHEEAPELAARLIADPDQFSLVEESSIGDAIRRAS